MTAATLAPTIDTCPACSLELDHCHGLLVEHDDGTTTCLDGCGGPRAVHDELVGCAELGIGCCGLADGAARAVPEELRWAA